MVAFNNLSASDLQAAMKVNAVSGMYSLFGCSVVQVNFFMLVTPLLHTLLVALSQSYLLYLEFSGDWDNGLFSRLNV